MHETRPASGGSDAPPTPADTDGSSATSGASRQRPPGAFRHELLLYGEGDSGFVAATLELVADALSRRAGVLVSVLPPRALALKEALGGEAERVQFLDAPELGRNPALIIPAWREFTREHVHSDGTGLGICESVWPGRGAAELDECHLHEELLNVAFSDGPGWRMLCPYDVDGLAEDVIEAARQTHPLLAAAGASATNERYARTHEQPQRFSGALPAPRGAVTRREFGAADLAQVRRVTSEWAQAHGLNTERNEELVLAVDELAANSIRHGGGAGTLLCWREDEALLCEVRDTGWIKEPLVGRSRPSPQATSGRGIWIANQLCDLVQIRSAPGASVVRVHKHL